MGSHGRSCLLFCLFLLLSATSPSPFFVTRTGDFPGAACRIAAGGSRFPVPTGASDSPYLLLCSWPAMDDGDIDFSNPETFLCEAMGNDPPASCSMGTYFDDILNGDTDHLACTHTHTCNPPVHDLAHHTHTCVHVHTKILSASDDAAETSESLPESKKQRPSGNRAAVRKYREKKKAHTALLEEEVAHLKAVNQQLVKKLQSHSALEAEVARLRCLLVDIRGRIEGEIGTFPYQRTVKSNDFVDQGSFLGGAQVMNSCGFRCNDQLYCNPGMQQARTMDDDGVMSGQVLGQGAGDSMGCVKPGSLNPPGCRGGQML
ncbi:hypothetical protein VPH35_140510 [Triticum aestivum]